MKPFVTPDSGQRTADTLKFTNHHLPITKSLHFKPSILVFLRMSSGVKNGNKLSVLALDAGATVRALPELLGKETVLFCVQLYEIVDVYNRFEKFSKKKKKNLNTCLSAYVLSFFIVFL